MKLLVRNLDRATTENEIREAFSNFGTVDTCDLVLDKETGTSKGFGFVEMPNETEAQSALTKLHMSDLGANKIRVKSAD